MDVGAILWLAKALPENTWFKYLDRIVILSIMAVVLACSAASLFRSYRRNRFCTCCRGKTVLGWRTEKKDPTKERITFGGKRVIAGTVTYFIPTLRCPRCGWEIDLGK